MSTVVYQTIHVYADTILDGPAAVVSKFGDGARYVTVLHTGKNTETLPIFNTIEEAITAGAAHADTLDVADSKETNLDLLFKIRQLEIIIDELRADAGAVEAVR